MAFSPTVLPALFICVARKMMPRNLVLQNAIFCPGPRLLLFEPDNDPEAVQRMTMMKGYFEVAHNTMAAAAIEAVEGGARYQ